MSKKQTRFLIIAVLNFILLIAASCNNTSSNPNSEPSATASGTSPSLSEETEIVTTANSSTATSTAPSLPTSTIPPEPIMTVAPTPTNTPDNTLRPLWTIETGNLQYLGVAEDGTIYGLDQNLYAIIDSDGNVVSTSQPDLDSCLRSNFSGLTGDPDIAQWLAIGTDGTFYSSGGCIIPPGQPDNIENFSESGGAYLPYALGNRYRIAEAIPEGYRFANFNGIDLFPQSPFWLDYRAETSDLKVNDESLSAGFINNEGMFIQFELPEIVPRGFHFGTTPWGDTYFLYDSFDALGNSTGEIITLLKPDGTQEIVDEVPQLFYGTYQNMTRLKPITYLPEQKEIYFVDERNTFLLKFDTTLTLKAIFAFPTDFDRFASSESIAVGNDGNFYFWHLNRNELTKYSIPNH